MSDIPNTEYMTITKDGIFVGGKPTTTYRGTQIWDQWHVNRDFKQFQSLILTNKKLNIVEMQVISTRLPLFDKWQYGDHIVPLLTNGERIGACCRIKTDEYGFGSDEKWVFYDTLSSVEYCNGAAAHKCVYNALMFESFRYKLLRKFYNTTMIFEHPAEILQRKKDKMVAALSNIDLRALAGQTVELNGYKIIIQKTTQDTIQRD